MKHVSVIADIELSMGNYMFQGNIKNNYLLCPQKPLLYQDQCALCFAITHFAAGFQSHLQIKLNEEIIMRKRERLIN
eukprot:1198917-Ditylum_brightwellii.AAC.1